MTAKANQLKGLLYSYMMLAMFVLLALFHTSPNAMATAAGSTAQHVLGVDQSGARAQRQLRPRRDGDIEDRMNLPFLTDDFVEKMYSMDVGQQVGLFGSAKFQEWAKSIDTLHDGNVFEAESAKINALLSRFDEATIEDMLKAAKKVDGLKVVAENLEIGLIAKYLDTGRYDAACLLLADGKDPTHLLKSHFWTAYIKQERYSMAEMYELALRILKKELIEPAILQMLLKAKEDPDTQKLATGLENYQLNKWVTARYTSDMVFERLLLGNKHIPGFDNPLWKTWISYLFKVGYFKNLKVEFNTTWKIYEKMTNKVSGYEVWNYIDSLKRKNAAMEPESKIGMSAESGYEASTSKRRKHDHHELPKR